MNRHFLRQLARDAATIGYPVDLALDAMSADGSLSYADRLTFRIAYIEKVGGQS